MAQGYIPRLQTALVAHSYSGMHGPRRRLLFYVIFSFMRLEIIRGSLLT